MTEKICNSDHTRRIARNAKAEEKYSGIEKSDNRTMKGDPEWVKSMTMTAKVEKTVMMRCTSAKLQTRKTLIA
jgi:hypothetical protein